MITDQQHQLNVFMVQTDGRGMYKDYIFKMVEMNGEYYKCVSERHYYRYRKYFNYTRNFHFEKANDEQYTLKDLIELAKYYDIGRPSAEAMFDLCQKQKDKAIAESKAVESEILKLKNEIENGYKYIKTLEAKNSRLLSSHSETEKEYEEFRKHNDELINKCYKLERENKRLEREAACADASANTYIDMWTKGKNMLEKLSKKKQKLQFLYAEAIQKLQYNKNEITKIAYENTVLAHRNTQLEKTLERVKAELNLILDGGYFGRGAKIENILKNNFEIPK